MAKVEGETFRNQADAETERRRLTEERHKSREAAPADGDDMPAALARHFAVEKEVNRNLNNASRRAQAIRDRAGAEGRELTDQEIESIDALGNAASAAEDSIRRGGASDIEA